MRTKSPLLALFVMSLALPCFLTAQTIKIRGRVFDVNTRRAIPYVNIYLKNTTRGTISDFAGRFSLELTSPDSDMVLLCQHINYDIKEIKIRQITSPISVYLQPRVIPLPEIKVEAAGEKIAIEKDLPLMVSVIKAKDFEIRGYVDAGDLLRTDHSIQVEEELSGKKTISIRGGNPDDVMVLYNGIKMNSEFNYIFDFSLIDLKDIERLEIIKGSNTALYGSAAFSGIVNIIPNMRQDYTIRFQQRVGTYDSGNWGLHFYRQLGKLHVSYHFRKGAAKRKFSNAIGDSQLLENRATHHTANLEYVFSEKKGGLSQNSLNLTYIRSSLDYNNYRENESLANFNQIVGLRYRGDLLRLRHVNLSFSQHRLDEKQSLTGQFGWLDRIINDRSVNIHTEKSFTFRTMDWLIAYQFEDARLNFYDERSDFSFQNVTTESAALHRQRHGFASIIKIHAPSGSDVVKTVDFDISFRHDWVQDKIKEATEERIHIPDDKTDNQWSESMVKFATLLSGYYQNFSFDIFMNSGTNVKFPALSQLTSSQLLLASAASPANLNPEKNRSVEMGIILKRELSDQPVIYGWQLSGNYLKNHYENKFRPYYIIGLPVAFYDNVIDASISGFEGKARVFLLRKKITLELGLSRYNVSEKAAFPFKYDYKRTFNFIIDHAGYSFLFHLFAEGKQIGWIRQMNGQFSEVILPAFTNIDIHLSKTFTIGKLKLFGNLSLRNLLNDDFALEGLALRDRRYYLTIGAQY